MVVSFKRRPNRGSASTSDVVFSGVVRDLASDGRGVVAHPSGRTLFVPGVWPGESGRFRVTGLKGRTGFAELIALDEGAAHPQRVAAPCVHHGFASNHCGGCPWQFMAYPAQLAAKQARVEAAMARLAPVPPVQPILPSPAVLGYRNRAQFKTDGERLGYVAAASNTLVPILQCPILSDVNQQTLAGLLKRLPEAAWRTGRRQTWRTLDIDETVTADAVIPDRRLPFRQANDAQNRVLHEWLSLALGDAPGASAVELFCGSGNLTEVLVAKGIPRITAVEVVEEALQALAGKALAGVEPMACDLFDERALEPVRSVLKTADILVLDPPRDGWKTREAAWPRKTSLSRIVSVSCDLATFSRDLAFFMAQGFRVESIQPLDQFPHTPHIELLACLTR